MKPTEVKKNEEYRVTIIDLSHEGLGVAKIDGFPLFIENALPGEEVQILVVKVGKKFGYGKVLEHFTTSPDRVADVNHSLIRTGIAPLHHLSYEGQLRFKQQQVQSVLERIAKNTTIEVPPVIGMKEPSHYRNKAQIPVRKVNGQLEIGFFRKNSHDLVPLDDFYLQEDGIDETLRLTRDLCRKYQVKPYNEVEHTGNLRHIIVRKGHYSGELMVVLVTRTGKIFKADQLATELMAAIPEVVSVMQNHNPAVTNVILGDTTELIAGQAYITDQLLGKTYYISTESFFQVNSTQAEVLYQLASDFADLQPTDKVIDAYCGIGTIGLSVADKVEHVYGMEVVTSAIKDAKQNASINHLDNVTFKVGKAEAVLREWLTKGIKADVLIVDPPRKGLSASFIDASLEMACEKIVYVSCNPATLARDIQLYEQQGYQLTKIQPVDMFPQTPHVECVVLLTKVHK